MVQAYTASSTAQAQPRPRSVVVTALQQQLLTTEGTKGLSYLKIM